MLYRCPPCTLGSLRLKIQTSHTGITGTATGIQQAETLNLYTGTIYRYLDR